MDKRDFLKTSGALVAAGVLSEVFPGSTALGAPAARTNWAGNLTYSAAQLETPATPEELRVALRDRGPLKPLGARHSFNAIADTTGAQISLKPFDHMELNEAAATVTVGAGVSYGHLASYLDSRGFAVHNLASLPHIGVVGACATATHGSGSRNGNLSTSVRAMELVTAGGEAVTLSPATLREGFSGAVVGLGALGVISSITLAVEPRFDVAQNVYLDLSFDQLEHNLERIFLSGYSVSLFTDWQHGRATQVWIKRRVEASVNRPAPAEFFGARAATRKMHPIVDHDAINCTEQMNLPGPWFERLPHFKMNFTPSSGAELQTEYFVPRAQGYQAIRAVEQLRDRITPHLFVTEFRTIAADQLWMSPAHARDSLAIHFTWKPETEAVLPILPLIEEKLAPFAPRPHWAKVFTLAPAKIQAEYAKLGDFKALVQKYDPKGKFRNAYLERNVYGV